MHVVALRDEDRGAVGHQRRNECGGQREPGVVRIGRHETGGQARLVERVVDAVLKELREVCRRDEILRVGRIDPGEYRSQREGIPQVPKVGHQLLRLALEGRLRQVDVASVGRSTREWVVDDPERDAAARAFK